jgi:hypothetical protein
MVQSMPQTTQNQNALRGSNVFRSSGVDSYEEPQVMQTGQFTGNSFFQPMDQVKNMRGVGSSLNESLMI